MFKLKIAMAQHNILQSMLISSYLNYWLPGYNTILMDYDFLFKLYIAKT